MKVEGDFIMTEDLNIEEDLIVKGNIYGKNGARFNIDAWDITAENINAGNINAGNINAKNIAARDITAFDINAKNINAWDITAGSIDAGNITALDIDAWDINALDINARDINYFAVCFAYKNINCKSIKGRRENCKHFVLDGEITIKQRRKKN